MNPIRQRRQAAVQYDGAFTFRVGTAKAGSAADTFVLPLATGTYDFTISWGDGSSQLVSGTGATTVSHTYSAAGVYVVRVKARCPRINSFPPIYFNNGGDKAKVLEIMQWGNDIWQNAASAFFGCENLVITALDANMVKTGHLTTFATMFRGCTALRPFAMPDTKSAQSMAGLFQLCSSLTAFPMCDTQNVTNMSNLCNSCSALRSMPQINTSKVTNLLQAWYLCSSLQGIPLLDTGLVTEFGNAFRGWSAVSDYNFPALDMHSITGTGGANMFVSTSISKASYNSMLDQWANGRGLIPAAAASGVRVDSGAHYDDSTGGYDGTAARSYLVGTKSWAISDGGTP